MPPLHTLLALMVALIWGVNTVVVRYGLDHMAPLLLTALRFVLVAAVIVPFVPIPKRYFKHLAWMSLLVSLHFALGNIGMWLGLDIASYVIAGQMAAPFGCLLGWLVFGDRMGKWRWSGMALALLGVGLIGGTPNVLSNLTGFFLVVAAALSWAISNLIIKRMDGVTILSILGWLALLAVPQMLLLSAALGEEPWLAVTRDLSPGVALSIAFSAFLSSILGYGVWYWLLRHNDVSKVVPFSLLSPFFAIGVGQIFYDEPLTAPTVAGGLITIAGVAILVLRRPKWLKFAEGT